MKYLVIDSIARSGTTLFSSLVRTQKQCVTFDGNFVEPYNLFGIPNPPLKTGFKKIKFTTDRKPNLNKYRNEIINAFENPLVRDRILMGKTLPEWKLFLEQDFNSFDELYDRIAKIYNSELIGFRWNQSLFYSPLWLQRSPEHYWAIVVRNPLDRTVSNMKTHNWNFQDCVDLSIEMNNKYLKLKEVFPRQTILIYYEDLIVNPKKEMSIFFTKIDFPIKNLEINNLVGSNNKPYRNQGWKVKKKKGDHRLGTKFENFYQNSVDQYRQHLSATQIKTFYDNVLGLDLFNRYL